MNREILFRGKKAYTGEWIYGYFERMCEFTFIANEEMRRVREMVDSETVGQFTGLTDKNGVKIFEGDILDLNCFMITDVGVVKFGKYKSNDMSNDFPCGHVGFYVDIEEHQRKRNYVRKDILFFASKCKIIGNIYDNPELLGTEGEYETD